MDRTVDLLDTAVTRAFRLLASLRSAKAVHTVGTVVDAEVVRHGSSPATGVGWIDEPGVDRAVVRFSRGAGLPAPLPDVFGIGLRVSSPDGDPWDLLLASSADRWPARRFPLPSGHWRRPTYSSISAFHTDRGLVLLGARWRAGRFLLAVADPRGPWRPFAELRLLQDPSTAPERVITYDPVLHPFPGLDMPVGWQHVREAAYAGSRQGRS
ncbi:hypothetical protein GTR02_09740 [Kineococcus sp. R8]|uniref:hypothetical protein n=1 Tax=Kineococcus siccus TaxID=2696567 RepID=UPI001413433F|nr:hypothetical protein [Kineococcus siccus]NAZ82098.1 hypothetical protein [Kineococcus siccus]